MLVAQSQNGCLDTISFQIELKQEVAVYIPNAFTPNNDATNETWRPFGKSAAEYEFTIWDRWGEKIFTGSDTRPWDGSVNGSSFPAHDGVYIYQVQILNSSVASDLITGRVSLVR